MYNAVSGLLFATTTGNSFERVECICVVTTERKLLHRSLLQSDFFRMQMTIVHCRVVIMLLRLVRPLELGAAAVGEIGTARVAIGLFRGRKIDSMNPARDWRIEFGAAAIGIIGTTFVVVRRLLLFGGGKLDLVNLGSLDAVDGLCLELGTTAVGITGTARVGCQVNVQLDWRGNSSLVAGVHHKGVGQRGDEKDEQARCDGEDSVHD